MTPIVNSNYDDNAIANSAQKIKFLYSYRGRILPRPTDGKLRYVGGHTRVLSVDRSITFAELMVRFLELCGSSMSLKCKLPTEDLDVLVTITSDEELVNLIEEYNRFSLSANKDLKITAVLYPLESLKKNLSSSIYRLQSRFLLGRRKVAFRHRILVLEFVTGLWISGGCEESWWQNPLLSGL